MMPETPATHYVKSDGIHIAYQVLGQGPFDLLFVPGFVSNVEATWRLPNFSAFFRRLASFCRVILFDKRGTGMSDRGSQIFTLEQRMHDVQAVLDEVGSKQAALFGVSEGGPMSLLCRHLPAAHLRALCCMARTPSDPGRQTILSAGMTSNGNACSTTSSTIGARRALSISMRLPSAAQDQDIAEEIASYYRASASPGAAGAIMRMNRDIDVREVLSVARVPTLILHRTADQVIDVGHARYLAQHISGAQLIEFPGEVHSPWLGDRDAILDAVEPFLTGKRRAYEPERLLATVLIGKSALPCGSCATSWRGRPALFSPPS
jgi:pimeloyl-ACP methyl ester carboxylesterase